jgi:hypothetical protein
MFFTNKPNVQSSKHSSDPKTATMYVDNEVRSLVAQEFTRMDQEHARIREEALVTFGPAQTEPTNERKLS